jgi:hypothetical protein
MTFTDEVLAAVDKHGHIDDIDYICEELIKIAFGVYAEIIGIDEAHAFLIKHTDELKTRFKASTID